MTIKRCFIDTETAGLTPRHAVVQIAAVVEIGDKVERFQIECAPHADDIIDPASLDISGRTVDAVRKYMPAREAHAEFTGWLSRFVDKYARNDKLNFLGYNAGFDNQMLRAWFDKARDNYFGSWFWSAPIDVMALAADRLIEERATMPNFKLATVCERVGISLDKAHDAMANVMTTRELYYWCRSESAKAVAA